RIPAATAAVRPKRGDAMGEWERMESCKVAHAMRPPGACQTHRRAAVAQFERGSCSLSAHALALRACVKSREQSRRGFQLRAAVLTEPVPTDRPHTHEIPPHPAATGRRAFPRRAVR